MCACVCVIVGELEQGAVRVNENCNEKKKRNRKKYVLSVHLSFKCCLHGVDERQAPPNSPPKKSEKGERGKINPRVDCFFLHFTLVGAEHVALALPVVVARRRRDLTGHCHAALQTHNLLAPW